MSTAPRFTCYEVDCLHRDSATMADLWDMTVVSWWLGDSAGVWQAITGFLHVARTNR